MQSRFKDSANRDNILIMPRTHAYSAANSVKFATLKRIVAKNVIKGSTLMKANACNVKVDAENVKIDKHALNAF